MAKKLREKKANFEDRVEALAEFLGLDEEEKAEIEEGYTDGALEYGREEYLVLTDDEADERAHEACVELFEEMGLEAVTEETQEYFLENEDFCNYDWKSDMHESNLVYAQDIDSEDGSDGYATRLIEEAVERKVIKDKDCFENEDGELDYEDKDELAEMLADDMDEDYDSMSEWFESIYGRNWTREVRDTLKDYLDYDAMADYVIDVDGRALQLATYDSAENEQGDFFIYRTN